MEKCDNKSVGVVVQNEYDETLVLSRARFPFGWAGPAGHVDDHGGVEQAAIDEVFEETGVVVTADQLKKVIDNRRIDNQCRRPGGDHHNWTLYRARINSQEVTQNLEETLGVRWMPADELARLALRGSVANTEGELALEPIWIDFFQELGVI